MKNSRFHIVVLLIVTAALYSAGCGGGGGDRGVAIQSTGSIAGYVYAPSEAGRVTGKRSAGAAPSGYQALSGATVQCDGKTTTTDSNGYYILSGVTVGAQVVSITKSGYQTMQISVTVIASVIVTVTPEGSTDGALTPGSDSDVNQSPTASAQADVTSGTAPLTIQFTGSGSDSDGTIASYSWTFGDGSTSSEQSPSHTYSTADSYTATLTVTDNDGATRQDTVTISVTSSSAISITASVSPATGTIDTVFTVTCTVSGGTATTLEHRCDSSGALWYEISSGNIGECVYGIGDFTPGCRVDGSITDDVDTPVTVTQGTVCGNGTVETGEDCDDGNTVTETCTYGETSCSVCDSTCQSVAGSTSYCSDSTTDTGNGEDCDDGNTTTETCDYGQTSCTVCDSTCQSVAGATSYCGDSTVDSSNSEQCDDGNTADGDGCSSTCQTESSDVWAKTFGGTDYEKAFSVQQTTDGGYIVSGYVNPIDEPVNYDFYIIKLSATGTQVWTQTLGGANFEQSFSIQQTMDGGYITAGVTNSYGAGSDDYWIVKLDSVGNQTWDKTIGTYGSEMATSISETSDGGYIVSGIVETYSAGNWDWVSKLDSGGSQVWSWYNPSGGSSGEGAFSVQQTTDYGYIVAGMVYDSFKEELKVVKLNSDGTLAWSNTYGGTGDDTVNSIRQTDDGGYIAAGHTNSEGAGGKDAWVLKLDSSGNQVWAQTYGGTSDDEANSVQQTTDGGYVVAGITSSYGAGNKDVWILKLDSSGSQTWANTLGGTSNEEAESIQQTTDGGYIVAGVTSSYGAGNSDVWVLKLDASGECTGCF